MKSTISSKRRLTKHKVSNKRKGDKRSGYLETSNVNPALKELEVFVGNWEMKLSSASFLPNPSATVEGHSSFEWLERGAYLVMYQGDKELNPPSATWLISRDEKAENYSIFYFDSRGVSRIYGMSFKDNNWKIWRSSPGFSQRFEGIVSENGNVITAHWEKSLDGTTWEHDFDMKYTRIKS